MLRHWLGRKRFKVTEKNLEEAEKDFHVLIPSPRQQHLVITSSLLRENPPILVQVFFLFSVFAQVQKALDVSLLFCFFLTDSISLLMLLCPRYSGIRKRRWLGEWLSQKMFMKETKHPHDKAEGTQSFHDFWIQFVKHLGSSDPAAALLAKT